MNSNISETYQILGLHLYRIQKYIESIRQYNKAIQLDSNNVDAHYGIGLAYLKNGEYEKSLEHAHIAYKNSYPLPGLKNLLIKEGKWK